MNNRTISIRTLSISLLLATAALDILARHASRTERAYHGLSRDGIPPPHAFAFNMNQE